MLCLFSYRLETIKKIGATAVMLTPVCASAPGAGQLGRAPISYFAPDNALAVGTEPGAACTELRQVICGLHDAGIEVILQACSPPQLWLLYRQEEGPRCHDSAAAVYICSMGGAGVLLADPVTWRDLSIMSYSQRHLLWCRQALGSGPLGYLTSVFRFSTLS